MPHIFTCGEGANISNLKSDLISKAVEAPFTL